MALETYRIYHIVDAPEDICNKQICVDEAVDADLGWQMWCGRDDAGGGPKTGAITKWLAKDKPARVASLNIQNLGAMASLMKTNGAGAVSAGLISIATLNSFLSDGPIPTCPVITTGEVVYGGGSAGTPITSKSSFFFDSSTNCLGIGHATPDCGIHVGANNPTYSSGVSDGFITGDLETTNIDLINTIRTHGFTAGSIPYLSGSPVAMAEANSNLYYTDTTFGAKVTPTDDNATIDILAEPTFSASGGHATINISAIAHGTSMDAAINISTTPGVTGEGDITIDSGDDLDLHAAQVVNITSATNKAKITLYPTSNGEIRFSSAWIYANVTNTYIPFSESSSEESDWTTNFGEVSILNAMNQLSDGLVSEPANQVVYGTGTGVDSDANLVWSSSLLDVTGKIRAKNFAWGTRTSASFASNTITANFSTGKDVQSVEINDDCTDLNFTAPDNGDAKGLQIRITSTGDHDVGNFAAPTTTVRWIDGDSLAGAAKTVGATQHAIMTLSYIDSTWYGDLVVFEAMGE